MRNVGQQAMGRRHALADVFSSQDDPTGLALEAADMPLFLQGQERLTLLDLLLATCTFWEANKAELTAQQQ